MKSVREWEKHWNAKKDISDPVEINGYCVGGKPLTSQEYHDAIVAPYLERLELEPWHSVLEIGCGSGIVLNAIEERAGRCVGTDLSRAMVERYQGRADMHVCEAADLPFEGEQFDRILMAGVTMYFPSFGYFVRVVDKGLSLLKRPGIFLIGDMLLGEQPGQTEYLYYNRHELTDYLDMLDMPYSISAQTRLKRNINRRYDVILYKD